VDRNEDEMAFLVVIEKANGNFSAYSPDVSGCVSTGKTREECAENMREALRLHLEELRRDGEPLPESRSTAEYVNL
jgi:predicted RNase H-like HicB family nuclease